MVSKDVEGNLLISSDIRLQAEGLGVALMKKEGVVTWESDRAPVQ